MKDKTIEIIPLNKIMSIIEGTNKFTDDLKSDKLYIALSYSEDNTNHSFIAVDNSTDDAWTEVFLNFMDAYHWLIKE